MHRRVSLRVMLPHASVTRIARSWAVSHMSISSTTCQTFFFLFFVFLAVGQFFLRSLPFSPLVTIHVCLLEENREVCVRASGRIFIVGVDLLFSFFYPPPPPLLDRRTYKAPFDISTLARDSERAPYLHFNSENERAHLE